MRATPPERVRLELGWTFEGREVPAVRAPAARRPCRARCPALADLMADYWERAIAPFWDAIRAVLEADIRQRARHLAERRRARAVRRPAPRRALARRRAARRSPPRGRGRARRPRAPARARGVRLAARGRDVRPAVAAVADLPAARGGGPVGAGAAGRAPEAPRRPARPPPRQHPRRARRRGDHDRARGRLAASPAGVSEHLGVLRRAGLVRARREGRAVLYSRTAAGDVLTAPASSPGSPS